MAGAYGYRPVLVETFVERARFAGTCYRADAAGTLAEKLRFATSRLQAGNEWATRVWASRVRSPCRGQRLGGNTKAAFVAEGRLVLLDILTLLTDALEWGDAGPAPAHDYAVVYVGRVTT